MDAVDEPAPRSGRTRSSIWHYLRREVTALALEPRVRFLGERRDVPCVMRAADILCQPNEEPEPFGVVLAEALLSGLPVVTTDAGGAREIVSDACGRLVPAGDLEALTRTLGNLIEDAPLRAPRWESAGPGTPTARCAPAVVMSAGVARARARPDDNDYRCRGRAWTEQPGRKAIPPIYRAAAALLRARRARGVLVDVGCGIGRFLEYASDLDCRLHRCRRRAASGAVCRTRPSIAPILDRGLHTIAGRVSRHRRSARGKRSSTWRTRARSAGSWCACSSPAVGWS